MTNSLPSNANSDDDFTNSLSS